MFNSQVKKLCIVCSVVIKLNYCIIHLFISGGQYHLLIFLQYCILLFSLFCCLISVSTVKFNNNNNNNNNNNKMFCWLVV